MTANRCLIALTFRLAPSPEAEAQHLFLSNGGANLVASLMCLTATMRS